MRFSKQRKVAGLCHSLALDALTKLSRQGAQVLVGLRRIDQGLEKNSSAFSGQRDHLVRADCLPGCRERRAPDEVGGVRASECCSSVDDLFFVRRNSKIETTGACWRCHDVQVSSVLHPRLYGIALYWTTAFWLDLDPELA